MIPAPDLQWHRMSNRPSSLFVMGRRLSLLLDVAVNVGVPRKLAVSQCRLIELKNDVHALEIHPDLQTALEAGKRVRVTEKVWK